MFTDRYFDREPSTGTLSNQRQVEDSTLTRIYAGGVSQDNQFLYAVGRSDSIVHWCTGVHPCPKATCGVGEYLSNGACASCTNWPCSVGSYQSGEACDGAGSADTQECKTCGKSPLDAQMMVLFVCGV